MKRQGRQAESFCTRPDSGIYAALIFGKPGAPVSEFAEQLAAQWANAANPKLDLKRVPPEEAKAAPDLIEEGLFSQSLFGGASLIQTNISRELDAKPFLDCLKLLDEGVEPPAGRLLLIAGDLTPRSTIRKTFEAMKTGLALHLFERTDRDFEAWVREQLAEAKLKCEAEAESLLVHTLLQDQSLARTEIEKLALYADGLDRPVNADDVKSLIVLEDQHSGFDLVDLALDGNQKSLSDLLQEQLKEASTAIPILIGLSNQVKRLLRAHELSSSGIQGMAIGQKLTPRIFDRQWPAFERRMASWSPERLFALMGRIEEVDTACRRAGTPQEALARRLLMDVAQVAAIGRRGR